MRAIERTTKQFVASLKAAIPSLRIISVERSETSFGRSNYVHIRNQNQRRYWKVRISDHAVGMRRAQSGREDLYLAAGAHPPDWAVWLSEFIKEVGDAPENGSGPGAVPGAWLPKDGTPPLPLGPVCLRGSLGDGAQAPEASEEPDVRPVAQAPDHETSGSLSSDLAALC